ncbi:response regulator [Deinococcus marmoris]|uniref:response regulator n=1 Tax=Deinococcus marmoris TaxID=249408 RepID=UPI0004978F20|nr:response regulator [Deinococcus marmoris]
MTRVLLVEDHLTDVVLLRELLSLMAVEWALEDVPTFAEAVGRWPGGAFDLLVVDLNLPDGQGLELLTRALELASGVPVVAMSGNENPRLAAQAVQLGARGYVLKDLEAAEHLHDIGLT